LGKAYTYLRQHDATSLCCCAGVYATFEGEVANVPRV
jgi:hypothetical protein